MDYSEIDQEAKEELAERVAMAVLTLENLANVVEPAYALEILLRLRKELIQLVRDLGGHPAIP
jgi:hypothetical protein